MNFKKIIVLISFLTISISFAQSNISIEVVYKKAMKSNEDKSNTPPKVVKGLSYLLKANDSVSTYSYVETMTNEAELDKIGKIARRGGNGIYYKNRVREIKLRKLDFLGEVFLITYPYNEWDIELKNETKKIGKYTCYKAILKADDYNPILKKKSELIREVWYTPEIPLPFGPAGYDGLPGLVLEVKEGGIYYVVDKIDFKKNNDSKEQILPPKGGLEVTKQGFNDKMFEIYKRRLKG